MTFKVGTKYMFKNKNSRKYLDIAGNQTGNNANVQQYEYLADAPSERFFLHQLDNNYYAMINLNSGKVIDIAGNQTGNNANIQQFEWLGDAPSEYWYFHREADGHYVIESKLSGKVLDIAGNSTANNANVQQYERLADAPSERFAAEEAGSVTLPSINTQPLLPVPEYETINDQLPEETGRVVTAFTVVPSIAVKDPHYGGDTAKQIKENPYYMVVKKQWWKKQESYVLAPGETYEHTVKTGIKVTDQETATRTVSWNIGADMGFIFKGFSFGLSTQYSNQLQTSISHTTEQLKEETIHHKIPNTSSNRMAYSRYILTTEYSVTRKNGTIVNSPWTLTDKTRTHAVTFPKSTGNLLNESTKQISKSESVN
ncbi:RICIN domain-containing protein [Bacillus pseudomycoides]|uniref:RICIN domain-containing protein n=1 Tax=Bacillus pseudomycoides TaxID=64104 RepID=UPI001FB1A97D|nr:RICIN domain-containing protein [Bacillus pseudomycoides]